MKHTRFLLAAIIVGALFGGNAMADPWFADGFDTYGSDGIPDQDAFRAIWSWDTSYDNPGEIVNQTNWLQGPFSWKMNRNFFNVRTWRSLVPAIQAAPGSNSSNNAVNGSAANPLIVSFQMDLTTGSGQ